MPDDGHHGWGRLLTAAGDNAIRWSEGERLHHLFEERCDALAAEGRPEHPAVITEAETVGFRSLDARASRLARHLLQQGLTAGDRIALLFDKTIETYVALLAVMKINAAYVPLDASFPEERIAFILEDAGVKAILSLSAFAEKFPGTHLPRLFLDEAAGAIAARSGARLSAAERPAPKDELCYVIYTSGTTGQPKGVAISQASISNFVRVAVEVYGVEPHDRVYQGMTIAFDFSVEEMWVGLMAGATLVPGRPGASLVGDDLADFLIANRVTVLACVPTLLATIEKELPDLRILLVSGEACPQSLVTRWHRDGRTILNAYGPTEATVTSTLTTLYPDKPVTIGVPLPTYTVVILDESDDIALERGALGEIGIAGVGLADGYLNRPELTRQKFIPDFIGIPGNVSGRIYRTGDVGRINAEGEVEFLGRIDTQVKIRGYRIELAEIEAVLAELPQIAQAVVNPYEPEPGAVELVAYYTLKQGAGPLPLAEARQLLKARLPAYMLPTYLEGLAAIPMTGSNKLDRKRLPPPTGSRLAGGRESFVAPHTESERKLARALAAIMKLERVSVRDNFFHDLGGHSLLMARFCSALRRDGTDVAIKDIYLNPTIETLARHLEQQARDATAWDAPADAHVPSALAYWGCGTLQAVSLLAYGAGLLWLLEAGFHWTYQDIHSPLATYARVVAFATTAFVGMTAIPIAAKWLLIGRWRPQVIPIWSLAYFRFWLVKTLVRSAPIAAFTGSPLYNLYLRLLGAKIGAGAVLRCQALPACADLLSVGANTILRSDCLVPGYKAEANRIHIGQIRIGADALVGEGSVLDIDTEIGDGAQLGFSSSLQRGERIPPGKRYHGSPAVETACDYRLVEPMPCGPARRAVYALLQLAGVLLFASAVPVALLYLVPPLLYASAGAQFANGALAPDLAVLAAEVIVVSFLVFCAGLIAGLAIVGLVPRLLFRLVRPGVTYPLYGLHYWVFRSIASVSNSQLYNTIFGDSALIVPYLRYVGYRFGGVVQTGSNFGLDQRHDVPFLCSIGAGAMVADGLKMINAPMSASSFVLRDVRIGSDTYLGNVINFPPGARVGSNCLLATKVLLPLDGPLRENVGLLGSPAFEIPRVVERDARLKESDTSRQATLVAAKTRYNLATMGIYVLSLWLHFAVTTFLFALALLSYAGHGFAAILAFGLASGTFSILFFALIERASLGFGRLRPLTVSMYDRGFWRHERYWKLTASRLATLFKGTPFKTAITRLLGVRLGRRVFDDGCSFIDCTLLEVGDGANLNDGCALQGHSLEEGVFKADRVRIGAGCTVGSGALVHYGVAVGDDVVIDPDSFVMKGEAPEPGTRWRGNPARALRTARSPRRLAEVALPAKVQVAS